MDMLRITQIVDLYRIGYTVLEITELYYAFKYQPIPICILSECCNRVGGILQNVSYCQCDICPVLPITTNRCCQGQVIESGAKDGMSMKCKVRHVPR